MPCQIDEGLSTNATPALRADERARQMLKIAYNIAKYDSAGQLLTANKEEQKYHKFVFSLEHMCEFVTVPFCLLLERRMRSCSC